MDMTDTDAGLKLLAASCAIAAINIGNFRVSSEQYLCR
jgi:hypothetical protein